VTLSLRCAATLGLIFPISYPGLRPPGRPNRWWITKLLRWPSAALLALHHINARDGSIVGEDTLARIPENFTLAFKLSNSDWSAQGAAESLMRWTSCNTRAFTDDMCHLLLQGPNVSTGRIPSGLEQTCSSTWTPDPSLAMYEAPEAQKIHAIVGVPTSSSAKIVSTIAQLHGLPVMSFGAAEQKKATHSLPEDPTAPPSTRAMRS